MGIFLVLFSQGLPLLVWIIHNAILYRDRVRKMNYAFQDCLPFCDHGIPGERGLAAFACHACHAVPQPETNTKRSTLYCVACWTCASSPSWWIIELGTAVSLLFWFGAGFYVGPAALAIAALLRVSEYGVDPLVPFDDLNADEDDATVRARAGLSAAIPGAPGGKPVGAELRPLLASAAGSGGAGVGWRTLKLLSLRPGDLRPGRRAAGRRASRRRRGDLGQGGWRGWRARGM